MLHSCERQLKDIFIENGYWGSRWAAPISSLIIEKYIKKEINRKWLEKYILDGDLSAEYLKPYLIHVICFIMQKINHTS